MENWLINFHFLRPWFLLLLAIPIFFYSRYFHGRNNQSSWEKVCDKKLLAYLLIKGSSTQRKIMARLALWGILFAIIAAAGPSWNKIEIPSLSPENPAMIVLNLSSEMKKRDLTPSRLERAKFKIKDFLSMLKGTQTGLEVYSSEPFLISPMTEDTEIIANLLPAIDFNIMPSDGDRLDRAIDLAVEKMKTSGFQQGEIIVLAPDSGQKFDMALEAAKNARNQKFNVNILAVNNTPSEKLKLIAETGGGIYQNIQAGDNGLQVLTDKINAYHSVLKDSKNWQSVWLDYGYYLLVLPLFCCLYFFRRGILVLTFMLIAYPADASFFRNDNQDGLEAFNKQDFMRAADYFKNAEWKGASFYRMGDYDQAYQAFSQGNDITSMYNQGNALAKGGKIEEAIKKYEEVLKIDPKHEDAKFNLEYLKRQQQNQPQPNQQPQNNNEENQDKDQNQNQASSGSNNEDSHDNQGDNPDNGSDPSENQNSDNQPQGDKQTPPADNSSENNNQENGKGTDGQQASSGEGQEQPQNGESRQPIGGEEQQQPQGQEQGGGQQSGENEDKFNEEGQARAQQYREIPEDPGGLLKAFIYKEYQRNRYHDK